MAKKAYVGVANLPKNVTNIYVGVNGTPKKVIKGYIGVNGAPKLFWDGGVTPTPTTDYVIYYDKQFPNSPTGTDITNLYIDPQWHTKTSGGTDITIDHLNEYFLTNKILVMQDNKVSYPQENYPYYFILENQAYVDDWNSYSSTYPIDSFYLNQGFIYWNVDDIPFLGSQLIFFIPIKRIYKPKKIKTTYFNTDFFEEGVFGNVGGACINPNNPNVLNYYPSTQQPDEFPIYNGGSTTAPTIDLSYHLCNSNIEYLDYIYIWTKDQPKHIIKIEIESEIDKNNIIIKSKTITPLMVKNGIENFINILEVPLQNNLRNSLNTNIDTIANYLTDSRWSNYTFSCLYIQYNANNNFLSFTLLGWLKDSTYIETGYSGHMNEDFDGCSESFHSIPNANYTLSCILRADTGLAEWGVQKIQSSSNYEYVSFIGYIYKKIYSYLYSYKKTFYDMT